jgi:glycosyltransferase involved in cell wall biosynthesis
MSASTPTADAAPRLIQMAEYGEQRPGSFIPVLAAIFAAARGRGWRIDAVFPATVEDAPWVAELREVGVEVHFCAAEGRRARAAWLRERFGSDRGPVLVHTHFTGWDVPAVSAFGRRRDAAIVWHVHTTLGTSLGSKARNMLKFATLGRRVSAFLCPAENIAADTRARLAPRDRVHFVPSAVRVEAFPMLSAEDRQAARARLEVPEGATVLLHFGWHWYLKGGDTFLATVAELRSRGRRDLVGIERGADDAGSEIAAMGLGDVVRVQPMVPDSRDLFAVADVLVTSSRSEGMAYAVLESLCSGTPVVATDIPGHAYIGAHAEACRIVGQDPRELADGIVATLDRPPELAAREAAAAREWIGANLSVETNAARLMREYYLPALKRIDPTI